MNLINSTRNGSVGNRRLATNTTLTTGVPTILQTLRWYEVYQNSRYL